MLTSREIADRLHDGGLRPGGSVMLHSSYKSLGGVEGGPGAVIDAFCEVLGPAGTLMAPTLLFNGSHERFLANYPDDIDLRVTPSRMGVLTETVRGREGAVRSVHPTHPAAAVGGRAEEMTRLHHLDETAVGPNSPWALNAAAGGWIVLLGVTHTCNTTLHYLEEAYTHWALADEPVEVSLIDTAGQRRTMRIRPHRAGLKREYLKVELVLKEAGLQTDVTIGEATVRLVRAAGLVERIGRIVREQTDFLLKVPLPPELTRSGGA